ncbi:MAG TPA: hypothetical protein VJQ82_06580 [Terriglobales bacterium]|nr:hypothetical protein [Terriglobales bacterium]
MTRLTLRIAAAILGILSCTGAQAGVASGQVTYFVSGSVNGVEILYVRLSTMSGMAGCVTANRFVMTAASPAFKTTVAMIVATYASGGSMFIDGAGTCNTSAGSEDLSSACFAAGC